MKKLVLMLAMTGIVGAGMLTPALACEGGKCKMEQADKNGKTKKGKKSAAQSESCHMPTTAAGSTTVDAAAPKSCCAKKEAPKTEAAKETKTLR